MRRLAAFFILSLLFCVPGYAQQEMRRFWRQATNPATCRVGDIVYNTATNAAYICTATNTWTFSFLGSGGNMGTGNFVLQGTTAAPTAPSGALAGAGAGNVDNGTHVYQQTCVTAGGETSASASSGAVTVADKTANGKVTVTLVACNAFSTGRNLYRSKAGTTTPLFLVAASPVVADGSTTTTYTDNIADASLQAGTAPTTNTAIDTRWTFNNTGQALGPAGTAALPSVALGAATNGFYSGAAGQVWYTSGGVAQWQTGAGFLNFGPSVTLSWAAAVGGAADAILGRAGAANPQWGVNSATPIAQTHNLAPSARGGTDSDVAGASATLKAGLGTGLGAGAQLSIDRAIMTTTGSVQQVAAHAFTVCESKTLSNTSATAQTLATVNLASNSAGGLFATITVTATDGTNFDSETQSLNVSYVNKAGTITVGTPAITTSTAANNSGSATIGATVTGATPTISLKVTPVFTTIVPTIVTAYVELHTHGAASTVTCQ